MLTYRKTVQSFYFIVMVNFIKLVGLVVNDHDIGSLVNKNTFGIRVHCRFKAVQHESFIHQLRIVAKNRRYFISGNVGRYFQKSDFNNSTKLLDKSMVWIGSVHFLNKIYDLFLFPSHEFVIFN